MTSFDTSWLRDKFVGLDTLSKPIMGISDWDDAAAVRFGGKTLVVSSDGPYAMRLVLKSALIHAATDVVVKGARPLYATDCLNGSREELGQMADSLNEQAEGIGLPIICGNTNLGGAPSASITVLGELVLDSPIRDSGAKGGDLLYLIGDPLWGPRKERIDYAKKLFSDWFEIIDKVEISAAKDVTKGGLANTAREIAVHSRLDLKLNRLDIHMYRNLDNFLVAVSEKNSKNLEEECERLGCTIVEAGALI